MMLHKKGSYFNPKHHVFLNLTKLFSTKVQCACPRYATCLCCFGNSDICNFWSNRQSINSVVNLYGCVAVLICHTTPTFKIDHYFDLKYTPVKLGADILHNFEAIALTKLVQRQTLKLYVKNPAGLVPEKCASVTYISMLTHTETEDNTRHSLSWMVIIHLRTAESHLPFKCFYF